LKEKVNKKNFIALWGRLLSEPLRRQRGTAKLKASFFGKTVTTLDFALQNLSGVRPRRGNSWQKELYRAPEPFVVQASATTT
jgi:hypothetical protein